MWNKLIDTYNEEPITNIIKEIRRKYGDYDCENLRSKLVFETELVALKDNTWLKEYIGNNSLSSELWYELVLYPWAYPSLVIKKGCLEMPQSFYWKTWLNNEEDRLMERQKSVGRIYNAKKGTQGTCFVIDINTVITTMSNVARISNNGVSLNSLEIDFSNTPYHSKKDFFRVASIERYNPKDELVIIKVEGESKYGNKLPSPLNFLEEDSLSANKIATIGYPYQFPLKMKERERIIYKEGSKLGYKNISLGIIGSDEKKQIKSSSASVLGNEGAPVIDIKTGNVLGVLSSDFTYFPVALHNCY